MRELGSAGDALVEWIDWFHRCTTGKKSMTYVKLRGRYFEDGRDLRGTALAEVRVGYVLSIYRIKEDLERDFVQRFLVFGNGFQQHI